MESTFDVTLNVHNVLYVLYDNVHNNVHAHVNALYIECNIFIYKMYIMFTCVLKSRQQPTHRDKRVMVDVVNVMYIKGT